MFNRRASPRRGGARGALAGLRDAVLSAENPADHDRVALAAECLAHVLPDRQGRWGLLEGERLGPVLSRTTSQAPPAARVGLGLSSGG